MILRKRLVSLIPSFKHLMITYSVPSIVLFVAVNKTNPTPNGAFMGAGASNSRISETLQCLDSKC